MDLGIGISSSVDPYQFRNFLSRLWVGTSPSCQEYCLINRLGLWKKYRIGIATMSYIFLDDLQIDLKELKKTTDLYISVGLGDKHRLGQYARSIDGLREKILQHSDLVSAVASSSPHLVKFAATNDLDVILNTADPKEILESLSLIEPNHVIAYLPVKLPDLPKEVEKRYDLWVSKMVGSRRNRSFIEVSLSQLQKRLNQLEKLEIKSVIVSAPWTQSTVGMNVISNLDVSYN